MLSFISYLRSGYYNRDLHEREIDGSDLRIFTDHWDGSKNANDSFAYGIDIYNCRGLKDSKTRRRCGQSYFKLRAECSLFPPDEKFGDQTQATCLSSVIQGVGCDWSPSEKMMFAYTGHDSSVQSPMAPVVSLKDSQGRRRTMHSALRIKIVLKDSRDVVFGAAIVDISDIKKNTKQRNVEVDILDPTDGKTLEGRCKLHIECFPLKDALEREIHQVVELQRYNPLKRDWLDDFLYTDPNKGECHFCSLDGKKYADEINTVSEPVKKGYYVEKDWTAEVASGDPEGFSYAKSFMDTLWFSRKKKVCWVRRRGWVRIVRKLDPKTGLKHGETEVKESIEKKKKSDQKLAQKEQFEKLNSPKPKPKVNPLAALQSEMANSKKHAEQTNRL